MLERTPREIRVQKGTSQGGGNNRTPQGSQSARGTSREACREGCSLCCLRQLDLTQDAFLDLVEIVPEGVGELVKKQAQGWAYIRP